MYINWNQFDDQWLDDHADYTTQLTPQSAQDLVELLYRVRYHPHSLCVYMAICATFEEMQYDRDISYSDARKSLKSLEHFFKKWPECCVKPNGEKDTVFPIGGHAEFMEHHWLGESGKKRIRLLEFLIDQHSEVLIDYSVVV